MADANPFDTPPKSIGTKNESDVCKHCGRAITFHHARNELEESYYYHSGRSYTPDKGKHPRYCSEQTAEPLTEENRG